MITNILLTVLFLFAIYMLLGFRVISDPKFTLDLIIADKTFPYRFKIRNFLIVLFHFIIWPRLIVLYKRKQRK